MKRIAICAPGKAISQEYADAVSAIAAARGEVELAFHPQCFLSAGHFAGDDAARLAALVECANDAATDALWFAAGGYGSCRIAAEAIAQMGDAARGKKILGYSDTGILLGGMYKAGFSALAHGPMAGDIGRERGAAAISRALSWLAGDDAGVMPRTHPHPQVAFNLTTLAMLCGTELMPDLTGHVVMVEEVSEHLYAVDRLFFHISQHLKGTAGLMLGRISNVPENDRPFGANEEEIARYWCEKSGIEYMGRADIGHDADNKIVPFGLAQTPIGA